MQARCAVTATGMGPNWRMRPLSAGLKAVGLSPDLLQHGIWRQVFLAPLAVGGRSFLPCETDNMRAFDISALPILQNFCENGGKYHARTACPNIASSSVTKWDLRDNGRGTLRHNRALVL
jgi:hypothetical protein